MGVLILKFSAVGTDGKKFPSVEEILSYLSFGLFGAQNLLIGIYIPLFVHELNYLREMPRIEKKLTDALDLMSHQALPYQSYFLRYE